jgi:hypothetical protein
VGWDLPVGHRVYEMFEWLVALDKHLGKCARVSKGSPM